MKRSKNKEAPTKRRTEKRTPAELATAHRLKQRPFSMVHNGEFSKIALKKLKLINGCTARWMRGKAGKALQQRLFFYFNFPKT
jgi:hypothetical protein